VLPKSALVPFTVHGIPARGPVEQVLLEPYPPVPQFEHGCETVTPLCTRESSVTLVAEAPLTRSAVPVTALVTWLMTHTETPPEESGRGAPKKNEQGPLPPQSAFVVH